MKISMRQRRVLEALLRGSVTREALDRIAGSSNSPDIIFRIRQKGVTVICERYPAKDRDGEPCKPGRYILCKSSEQRVIEILGQ